MHLHKWPSDKLIYFDRTWFSHIPSSKSRNSVRKLRAKLCWVKILFQKSKFNISLGSQNCTSRLFNSFLALPVPLARFPGCFQKDRCTYSACVLENHGCLSALRFLPDLTSVCFSSGWGSFGKGHLVPAPGPSSLHWEKTFQQTWYLNTGQNGVGQMLHQWFRYSDTAFSWPVVPLESAGGFSNAGGYWKGTKLKASF